MSLLTRTKIVLMIEYEGTEYCGFQLQAGSPTVQGEIEKAFWKLTGERVRVIAASRTDAGVHARGQMVSIMTPSGLPLAVFVNGLNHYLPADIAARAAFRVKAVFSVRREALSREYEYTILNSWTRSPLKRGFYYQVRGELDTEAMKESCRALVGEHNFASFTTPEDCRLKQTVRSIEKAEIVRNEEMIVFRMIGKSFLHHQVRNTVGALIRVGLKKMTTSEFENILNAGQPGLARPRAPACGLCLTRINYPVPFWEEKWGYT